MLTSTTRLTIVFTTGLLMACAKSGVSQDIPVVKEDTPATSESYENEVFFPYQKQKDLFTQSTLVMNPNGTVRFHLSFFPRESNPATVMVNGVVVTSGFTLSSTSITFQPQPGPNAKITVSYDVENLNDVMQTEPIVIPGNMDLQSLRVALNGVLVSLSDLRLSINEDNDYVFDPSVLLFDFDDPYHVYASRGLDIHIAGIVVNPR